MLLYYALSVCLGVVSGLCAYLFGRSIREDPERWERLPRHRPAGLALGIVCLVWSAWHGCIMLEGGLARYHALVWLLVPATAVLGYFWLDHLFARSLGGFIVLAVNFLLHAAFVHGTFLRGGYSLLCLAWGVVGLFLVGMPWCWRETMRRARGDRRVCAAVVVFSVVSSVCFVVQPLL